MCQKLYFPTEDYSLGTYIVVNSALTYLFRDMDRSVADKIGMTKAHQYKYAEVSYMSNCLHMHMLNLN